MFETRLFFLKVTRSNISLSAEKLVAASKEIILHMLSEEAFLDCVSQKAKFSLVRNSTKCFRSRVASNVEVRSGRPAHSSQTSHSLKAKSPGSKTL